MKRYNSCRVVLLPLLMSLLLGACNLPAPEKKTEVPRIRHNYIVLLDLSDRLIVQEDQPERDKEIIKSLYTIFEEKVKHDLYIKSKDEIKVVLAPQTGSGINSEVFEDRLYVNMNTMDHVSRKAKEQERRANFLANVDTLYDQAVFSQHPDDYHGADIWKYFYEDLKNDYVNEDYTKNYLFILTDGYPIVGQESKLLQVKNEFPELEIVLLEAAPREKDLEWDHIMGIWEAWFNRIGITKYTLVKRGSITKEMEQIRAMVDWKHSDDKSLAKAHSLNNYRNDIVTTHTAPVEVIEQYKKEKRYALVVGNSNYKNVPVLRNPVNDATDMAQILQSMNFEVITLTDATYMEIRSAYQKLQQKLVDGPKDQTVGLVYYSGHGLQYDGENYLVPVDANLEYEDDIPRQCFPLQRIVLTNMERSNSRMNILILDACRDNSFPRVVRSVSSGLAEMKTGKGSFIAYATAPGSTASDGVGRNGLYTQELLKAMQKPGLSIEQVFKEVRINVLRLSGERQFTWDSSNITGEFYFNLNNLDALNDSTKTVVELPVQ